MIKRHRKGCYRSKIEDHKLHKEILGLYERFIQPSMLKQVYHAWNIKNETMNKSVVALAPK